MSALRDWGHARDYVEMQWLMLQQESAEDFVIATGIQHSVRKFVECAALELGIVLRFEGAGVDEIAIVEAVENADLKVKQGDVVVRVDSRYFRPTEVETLLGDATSARSKLGWTPRISFEQLVKEMVRADYQAAKRDALIKLAGFTAFAYNE